MREREREREREKIKATSPRRGRKCREIGNALPKWRALLERTEAVR